jgi:hypothetical protein
VDCQVYLRCSAGDISPGCTCITIPGCSRGICALPASLCAEECGGDCAVLESFPIQLKCEGGGIIHGFEGMGGGHG